MSSGPEGFFGWPTEEPEPDGVPGSADPKPLPRLGFPLAEQLGTAVPAPPVTPSPDSTAEFRFPAGWPTPVADEPVPASWDASPIDQPRGLPEPDSLPKAPMFPEMPRLSQPSAGDSSGYLQPGAISPETTILPSTATRRARNRQVQTSVAVPQLPRSQKWLVLASAAVSLLIGLLAIVGIGPVGMMFAVAVFSISWPILLELPAPRGASLVIGLAGAGAILSVALTTTEPRLRWMVLPLAFSLVAAIVHQLFRRERGQLVESLAGEVAGSLVVMGLAAPLALPETGAGRAGVAIWSAACVAALLGELWRGAPGQRAIFGCLAAAVSGGLLGQYAGFIGAQGGRGLPGALAGLGIGAVGLLFFRSFVALSPAQRGPAWLAVLIAPAAGTAMVGYILLRLLLG